MLRDPTHVIGRVSSTASFSQAIKSPILNVTPTPCPPTRTDSGNCPLGPLATACVPTRCPSRSWGSVPCCDVERCNEGIGRRDLLYYADPGRTTASPIRRMSTSVEDGWRESSRTPGHAPARRGASMGYPTLAPSQRPPVLRQNLIPLG